MNQQFSQLLRLSEDSDREIEYTIERVIVRPAGFRESIEAEGGGMTVPVFTPVGFTTGEEPDPQYEPNDQIRFGVDIEPQGPAGPRAAFDCTDSQKLRCIVGAFADEDGTQSVWDIYFGGGPRLRTLDANANSTHWASKLFLKQCAPQLTSFWLIVYNQCIGPKDSLVKKLIEVLP